MRRRLREILDRAHCTVGGDEQETGGGGGSHDIDELEFEEEVLGLDYLDEVGSYVLCMHVHSLALLYSVYNSYIMLCMQLQIQNMTVH